VLICSGGKRVVRRGEQQLYGLERQLVDQGQVLGGETGGVGVDESLEHAGILRWGGGHAGRIGCDGFTFKIPLVLGSQIFPRALTKASGAGVGLGHMGGRHGLTLKVTPRTLVVGTA
jgi:hypothetical protein